MNKTKSRASSKIYLKCCKLERKYIFNNSSHCVAGNETIEEQFRVKFPDKKCVRIFLSSSTMSHAAHLWSEDIQKIIIVYKKL